MINILINNLFIKQKSETQIKSNKINTHTSGYSIIIGKQPKQEVVRRLLKFFTIPPKAEDFYNDIFKENNTSTEIPDEDCQQSDEDEIINSNF